MNHSLHDGLLEELLAEQLHSDEVGQLRVVEDLLRQHPALSSDNNAVLELIAREISLRRKRGEQPTIIEYLGRFPQFAEEVLEFLRAGRDSTDHFDATAALPTESRSRRDPDSAGIVIPGYETLAVLGRGGMGVVYKARHLRLNRVVAVKMVLAGAHAHSDERQRLHTEAEAIARLQHPNIVQIFEVGEVEGCPFLALEFVEGGTLAQRLNGTPWAGQVAAGIIETLARTIHHAHEHGIIHRDLKPANVLISVSAQQSEPAENVSGAFQTSLVKITDFGLARMLEGGPGLTQTGAFMGTPSYAAPEQAMGSTRSSGPPADIYALGAMLYELLTGRPPFRAASVLETLDQLRTQDPVSPRLLNSAIDRDLETICLKCLRKSPAERYATAADLADDLHRFLIGEPIRARAAGVAEQFVKWVKRRPALAASILFGVVAGLALLVLGVGWTFYARLHGLNARLETTNIELSTAKKTAELASSRARELEAAAVRDRYVSDLQLASRAWQEGQMSRMAMLLERQKPEFTGTDLRGFEWHYLHPLVHSARHVLHGGDMGVMSVACTPGSSIAAAGNRDGHIKLWDTDNGREFLFFPKQNGSVTSVAFAPDATRLATAIDGFGQVLFWDLIAPLKRPPSQRDGKLHREEFLLETEYLRVPAIAFDRDGRRFAAVSFEDYKNGAVQVWDVDSRREIYHRPIENVPYSLAFHPDGRQLATGTIKQIKVWNLAAADKKPHLTIEAHGDVALVAALAYSSDGRHLVSAARDKKETAIKVWSAVNGTLLRQLEGHTRPVTCLAFNADGNRLASGSHDTTARVWDITSGQPLRILKGHTNFIYAVAFHWTGKQLATGSDDQSMRIWDIDRSRDVVELTAPEFGHHVSSLHFANGDLVAGTHNGGIAIYNPATCVLRQGLRLPMTGKTLVSRDGRHAVALHNDTAKVWNVATGKEPFTVAAEGGSVRCAAFDPTGSWLALGRTLTGKDDQPEGRVELWDLSAGVRQPPLRLAYRDIHSLSFSPDCTLLAIGGENAESKSRTDLHALTLWSRCQGAVVFRSTRPITDAINAIAFSPDGKRVAWVSADGGVSMFEHGANEERLIGNHVSGVHAVVFAPDGTRLATGGEGDIRLWDVAAGVETLALNGHIGEIFALTFSDDGQMLASGGWDTVIRVWPAPVPVKP